MTVIITHACVLVVMMISLYKNTDNVIWKLRIALFTFWIIKIKCDVYCIYPYYSIHVKKKSGEKNWYLFMAGPACMKV